jgi:hypothetical protein
MGFNSGDVGTHSAVPVWPIHLFVKFSSNQWKMTHNMVNTILHKLLWFHTDISSCTINSSYMVKLCSAWTVSSSEVWVFQHFLYHMKPALIQIIPYLVHVSRDFPGTSNDSFACRLFDFIRKQNMFKSFNLLQSLPDYECIRTHLSGSSSNWWLRNPSFYRWNLHFVYNVLCNPKSLMFFQFIFLGLHKPLCWNVMCKCRHNWLCCF